MSPPILLEIRDAVAIGVVSARDKRVIAHRTPDAFSPDQLGEAVYELAASAIEATSILGGEVRVDSGRLARGARRTPRGTDRDGPPA